MFYNMVTCTCTVTNLPTVNTPVTWFILGGSNRGCNNIMIALIMICDFHSVCLFKHANYVGDVICSGPGSVDYSEIYALGLNDHLSSATVPIGLEVTVYEHAGFTGDTRVYTEDTSFFTDFNDIISSFIVSEAEVCFFQHVSYEGSEMCESIGRGQVDYFEIRDAGFNDIFSSVTVPRGVKVTAYEHAGLGGDSRVFTQDTPNFLDSDIDFNDIISSFVIELA